ncbi:MAG: hypothetical protein QM757_17475 [Paludibaculum sp.]
MQRTLSFLLAAAFTLATASAQFAPGANKGYGPKDGSGYGVTSGRGNGPKDGTGYGARSGRGNGTGTCDQTGPKGTRRGGQSRGGRR